MFFAEEFRHLIRVVTFGDLPTIVLEYLVIHCVHYWISLICCGLSAEDNGRLDLEGGLLIRQGDQVAVLRRLRGVLYQVLGSRAHGLVHQVSGRIGARVVLELLRGLRGAQRQFSLALTVLML